MATIDPEQLLAMLPHWAAGNRRIAELLAEHEYLAPALEQYGMERYAAADYALAAKAFTAASALMPEQPIYRNNLGVALDAAGDAPEAIAAFRASLAIDANQPQIWLNLAYTLKKTGQMAEAEQALTTAASHASTSAEAFTVLGNIELDRADYAEAVAFLRHALEAGGNTAGLHAALGAALFQLGQAVEARDAYAKASALAPDERGYRENLDFLTMLAGVIGGEAEKAVGDFARPLDQDAVLLDAFERALLFLTSFEKAAAKALVAEWIQYYPEDADALYFIRVFSGKPLARAPAAYLAQHFDRLATQMNARFIQALDYRVPGIMAGMLDEAVGTSWRGHVLDAGCGNGALGRELKPAARSLAGIDLSPGMIALANETGIYDTLVTGDLLPFLQEQAAKFDLIAAADSLIYFGALEAVFAAVHGALRTGGWFMLSLETDTATGKYGVAPNGRFKHARSYVGALAGQTFEPVREQDGMLRRQAGQPVEGTIYLLRKV